MNVVFALQCLIQFYFQDSENYLLFSIFIIILSKLFFFGEILFLWKIHKGSVPVYSFTVLFCDHSVHQAHFAQLKGYRFKFSKEGLTSSKFSP